MRRRAERCLGAVLVAALVSARVAGAEELPPGAESAARASEPIDSLIEVERGSGAQACPDAAAVFRSIARLFPERSFRESSGAATARASARVVIRALAPGFEAVLTMRAPHAGERVILVKDEACAGLADALALAFVLLVEPPQAPPAGESNPTANVAPVPQPANAAAPVPPSKSETPPPSTPPPSAPANVATPKTRGARSFPANLEAAGLGGFGLLSKPAGGAAVGLELFLANGWGGRLDGVRLWSSPSKADGGSVELSVWALVFGPCYERRLRGASSLDACVLLGIGSQHAKVEGFQSPGSGDFPWAIVAPAIGYRLRAARMLSGFVRVGPVVQLRPQSFSVKVTDGSGGNRPVAGAPNVGVMAELGLLTGDAGF